MKKRDLVFRIFGIYFIVLSIIAVVNSFVHPETANPLWFCYIAVFFIGLGILLKKSGFIATQINIMAIPLVFWNIDFFHHLITSRPLWGITDYFFATGFIGSVGNFITLQHLYVLPVSIAFIWILGIEGRNLWKYSFIEVALVFLLGLIFTPLSQNINCMFKSCINFISLRAPYYQALWFFAVFLMIIMTNNILLYFFKNSERRGKRKE